MIRIQWFSLKRNAVLIDWGHVCSGWESSSKAVHEVVCIIKTRNRAYTCYKYICTYSVKLCCPLEIWMKFYIMQWNLYKATTKFCGLSRQVVFHDREKKTWLCKDVPGIWWNVCVFSKTSPVSLCRFHSTSCIQANFSDWWLRYLMWNCPQVNVTGRGW